MKPFTIGLGLAPESSSFFASALPLLKPSLLYADRVVVFSPSLTLVTVLSHVGAASDEELLLMLEEIGPILGSPDVPQAVEMLRALRRKKRRTRDEVLLQARFDRKLKTMRDGMSEAMDRLLERHGADEWLPAIEAGLVEIDLLGVETGGDPDNLMEVWIERLLGLLEDPDSYPVFDSKSTAIVRGRIDAGASAAERGARERRARHGPTAAGFLEQLPTFRAATVSEVVDLRRELLEPLVKFRRGVQRLVSEMTSSPVSDSRDFYEEVAEAWDWEVVPAVDELRERINENRYVSQLATATGAATENVLTSLMYFGVASISTLPEVVTPLVTGGSVAIRAAIEKARGGRRIREHEFFFLHELERRLGA